MSQIPESLRYVESHEWLRLEEDGSITVGITDHAQEALGDVVFVELPKIGSSLDEGAGAGVVESVKAASDVYSPIAGVVVAINEELEVNPDVVNHDPYGEGWFFRIKPANPGDFEATLDADGYAELID